jgi:hypothetical protein
MTEPSHFQQLLRAAAAQAEPQRLLFVFAGAELPDHPTAAQREGFEAGDGGALAPLMCVDKAPGEVKDFEALVAESRRAGPPWRIVFAAGLSGHDGRPPTAAQIEPALEKMVHAVRLGVVDQFAAYAPDGEPVIICEGSANDRPSRR